MSERCQHCGYTEEDKRLHGDHRICEEAHPPEPEEADWQRLRLTLLWHFGTTDPELIHDEMEGRRPEGRPETEYAEMLKSAARVDINYRKSPEFRTEEES